MPRSYTTHAKHASIVPQAATVFEELVAAAGAPKGAWTNIFASREQIAALIADDRVQGATLTGSEKAGGIVATEASKSLKKSVLELGGADVFVVLDDADLDKAVKVGAAARLNVAGQACNAAKRFLVHRKVADRFLEKFTETLPTTRSAIHWTRPSTWGRSARSRRATASRHRSSGQ